MIRQLENENRLISVRGDQVVRGLMYGQCHSDDLQSTFSSVLQILISNVCVIYLREYAVNTKLTFLEICSVYPFPWRWDLYIYNIFTLSLHKTVVILHEFKLT